MQLEMKQAGILGEQIVLRNISWHSFESLLTALGDNRSSRLAFEPDSGFYFQNELLVRSNTNIDLSQDPPPDLILEVDFSNQSLNKFPIYISLPRST